MVEWKAKSLADLMVASWGEMWVAKLVAKRAE